MLQIIEGVRPEKPNFVITRGYTEELWKLSTACWGDPTGRPTAGEVLVALGSAAEQWEAKHSGLSQDDWSPTPTEEYSPLTVSEHENESPTTTASPSLGSLQPPVIEAPAPALVQKVDPPSRVEVRPEVLPERLQVAGGTLPGLPQTTPSAGLGTSSESPTVPERKSQSVTTNASASLDPHQPLVIKPQGPVPALPAPTPPPSILLPPAGKDRVPPKSIPDTSSEGEKIKPAPVSPPKEVEPDHALGKLDQGVRTAHLTQSGHQ